MTSTHLFIVRHGESTWNAIRRWQGSSDPPLSERGEDQARAAGAALDLLGGIDGVVTSAMQRARRTGELLAEVAGVPLLDPVEHLGERCAGAWEGLTRVEIEEQYPGFLASGDRPEGFEPEESVVARAFRAVATLVATHVGRRLVVVSHGGVIHALERHIGAVEGEWQRLDNLEGRWFVVDAERVCVTGDRIHLLADAPATPEDEGYL